MILVSMKVLPVGIVFCPEFFELLNNFIVPANLLVDDKQHRVEWAARLPRMNSYFGFHNGPLHVPTRGPQRRGDCLGVPPLRVVSSLASVQARAGTVSAQVSTAVRIGLIRIGGEGDLVTAEVQHVEFAVGIVAPEGGTEIIIRGIVDGGTGMCRGDCCGCQQRGYPGAEPGEGVEPVGTVADVLCIPVLVVDPCGVRLPWSFLPGRGLSRRSYTLHRQTGCR